MVSPMNPIIDVLTVNQVLFLRTMLVVNSQSELETETYIEACKALIREIDETWAHSAFYCSEI